MRVRFNVDFELSPRVKRLLKIGIPTTVLLAGGVALAAVPHTFADGDPLSAQTMNDNFANLDMRMSSLESLMGGDGGASTVSVWRDSTNTPVPIIEIIRIGAPGTDYHYYNFYDQSSKAIWQYKTDVNMQWVVAAPYPGLMVGYVGNSCNGTAYVMYAPGPRYAFTLGTTGANTYYVVPDNAQLQQVAVSSTNWGSGCTAQNSGATLAVALTSLKTVSKPSVPPGTPPYHQGS